MNERDPYNLRAIAMQMLENARVEHQAVKDLPRTLRSVGNLPQPTKENSVDFSEYGGITEVLLYNKLWRYVGSLRLGAYSSIEYRIAKPRERKMHTKYLLEVKIPHHVGPYRYYPLPKPQVALAPDTRTLIKVVCPNVNLILMGRNTLI